ncbi:glycosyltransferase family 4 protein [Aetokthonos hydrillicola Thurmond2011]|uniref:Glycosyltransferase family 4 protein n=2 Tax=Aetokthonos TaxID=1550243 RepID=A0AAP5IBV1_9CYAN|nr:glycosyltransferase family 4 protein [Aetokthonos hydrillicola]MBW4589173.1 glycosyltransferase family 4 protein [Aetokthonos hydrillicola CCALA 1050]MDR9898732.1 glycosyltransferase family 4 protein [Aetokthonos hydrillicola Thurmond2011]
MQIIHASYSDLSGGAARAAYRIHRCLLQAKINSRMQVLSKISDDSTVTGNSAKIGRITTEIRTGLGLLAKKTIKSCDPGRYSAGILPSNWVKSFQASDADVINLHWVGAETLSISEIGQIRKPIVWTFHDMWAFCGAEHYTNDGLNARWRQGYRSHNRPQDESGFDLNRWTWERKRRNWKYPFHIVCPSKWLADCVRNSALMPHFPVSVIPNPLDLDSFRPIEKTLARKLLNLPQQRSLILFGALGGTNDPRKGIDLLLQAISFLETQQLKDIEIVIFGQSVPEQVPKLGFPLRYTGHLGDDISLALLYSAADVFVAPSRQDNLPNTVVEAIACGTPTVAFKIGGMPDLIDHKVSGYLAQPYEVEDLATGIQWVIEQQKESKSLSLAARRHAEYMFDPIRVAQQYVTVYKEAVNIQKN